MQKYSELNLKEPQQDTLSFTHHFLIAMPHGMGQLTDALIYICDHTEEGAMGVIVNYPLELTVADLLVQMGIEQSADIDCSQSVYYGGTMQYDRGFVLHRPHGNWFASLALNDELMMTTSRDILAAMAEGKGPTESMTFLGYLGWDAGQLETEMTKNMWINHPADPAILFDIPYQKRRDAVAQSLGVDLSALSHDAGHA